MYKIKRILNDKDIILGEMPNIYMPTMGGTVFWDTKKETDLYKLQVNKITGHARILDYEDNRVAWGTYEAMVKKFRILNFDDTLKSGDIIGVKRFGGLYEHYAVYIGNDEVIHYAGQGDDFSDNICIHRAPIEEFFKDSEKMFVLDFPDEYGRPTKIAYATGAMIFGDITDKLRELVNSDKYHLYSPSETVKRAKSRLGECDYNLATNNCEHFAIWCKTGISESHQVNMFLRAIAAQLPIIIR